MQKLSETILHNQTKSRRGRCSDGTPNPIDVHVGNRIRTRRNLLCLSQEKLGELMGLTFQQIQKYERGANRIGASRLWDLSSILEVDINYFFQDMPLNIAKQSPRMFSCNPKVNNDENFTLLPTPLEKTSEAQELLKNYFKIHNRRLANQIFNLIKILRQAHTPHTN